MLVLSVKCWYRLTTLLCDPTLMEDVRAVEFDRYKNFQSVFELSDDV